MAPSWEWVRDVGSTKQYKDFLVDLDYHEEMRRQGREEEDRSGRYEVERIFYQVGNEVVLLWSNFDEVDKVNIQNVKHLEVYKEWKRSGGVFVIEESEKEEDSEEKEEEESEEESERSEEEDSSDGKEEVTEESEEVSEESGCESPPTSSEEDVWLSL